MVVIRKKSLRISTPSKSHIQKISPTPGIKNSIGCLLRELLGKDNVGRREAERPKITKMVPFDIFRERVHRLECFYLAREAGQNRYVMNSRVPDNPFFSFLFIDLRILSSSKCVTL